MFHYRPVWRSFVLLSLLGSAAIGAEPIEVEATADTKSPVEQVVRKILLADQSTEPVMTVRWMTSGGEREISGVMSYGPPKGGVVLMSGDGEGKDALSNIRAYLALGGSRIDTGAGHPKGLVIRAGLTKVESARPFFEDIEPGSDVEIEISGVVLSEPIQYHEGTGIMHLKYAIGDLLACSLPGTARNQYLLSDPKDTLGGRVVAGVNATPGALGGATESGGAFDLTINADDARRMGYVVRVPYGYFRHLQDPWDSTLPGTFFEPIHLHAEAELIPVWATPLDREWIVESNEPVETKPVETDPVEHDPEDPDESDG